MEQTLLLRLIGLIVIAMGLVITINPEWITQKSVPENTFDAVERRIWWGLIIGLGCLLMFHHTLMPWQATVAATLASLLFGLLIARLIGICLDGSVTKQWLYVFIEILMLLPLIWWYKSTS